MKRSVLDDDSLREYLGAGLLTSLAKTPLVIGKDTFTMRQLAKNVGVTNARAAGVLSKVAKLVDAKDVADFYAKSSPLALARLEGVGSFTVYVALRVFESRGLNGHAWFNHRPEGEVMTTFATIKRKESLAAARTKRRGRTK